MIKAPEHYSYSSIKTWYQCPAKWFRKYLLGEPDTPSYESLIGIFVHKVLENTIRPARPASKRTLLQIREEATRLWSDHEWAIPAVRVPEFKAKVWDCLSALEKIDDPRDADVLAAELEIRTDVEWNNTVIPFLGYIDRVDMTKNGGVTLVDYKTGRRPLYTWYKDALRQLVIYAAALRFTDYEPKPNKARLIYLGSGNTVNSRITKKDMEEATLWFDEGYWHIQRWLAEPESAIRRAVTDMASASHLCGWCPYESDCPTGLERPSRLRSPQHQIRIGPRT